MNYRCYQIILRVKHFTQIGGGANCLLDFIIGASAWQWLGEYITLDKNVLKSSFHKGSSGNPSHIHMFLLIAFLVEVFIRNIVIIQCLTCIIIMCINNSAVINKNSWKTVRTYFVLQNSVGHARGFYRNLYIIWARTLKPFRQPLLGTFPGDRNQTIRIHVDINVGFDVLTAMLLKIRVLWDAAPCQLMNS